VSPDFIKFLAFFCFFFVGVITIRMLKRTSARYWTIKVDGVDWHVAFGLLNPGNVMKWILLRLNSRKAFGSLGMIQPIWKRIGWDYNFFCVFDWQLVDEIGERL
jgi:hypothetical protein